MTPQNHGPPRERLISNFRSPVCQALVLEIGETVQILEKSEGWYRGFSTRKPSVKKHKVDLFHKLRHVMNELMDLRRQLIQGHLAQDQTRELKRHITVRLDWGNEWHLSGSDCTFSGPSGNAGAYILTASRGPFPFKS
ncbi:hypothetical protein CRUP_000288 [Coryphaenoides rupestris]|nr:hypothetical protein CRUP_000288 [Coryphaenoides rupestris]